MILGSYCLGCCRTLDEKIRWRQLSQIEREEIMSRLDQRREKLYGQYEKLKKNQVAV